MGAPFKLWQILPNLKVLVRAHGIWFPFIALARVVQYFYYVLCKQGEFEFEGAKYRYFYHLYNPTFRVERCVEVPLVLREVQSTAGRILEVGNVLAHYVKVQHEVVDKYEQMPGVINADVVSFQPGHQYDLIVSISTLEHVGWDEEPKDPRKIPQAVAHLIELLKPGGKLLVTMPKGYNPHLDELAASGTLGFQKLAFLRRVSGDNRWRQANYVEIRDVEFGRPYPCANALIIGSYTKPVT